VWGRASVWAGLALASGLGRFGASAGRASHVVVAAALASVPRELCAMRRVECSQMLFSQAAMKFNQNLGSWNVAKVQTMYGMFDSATTFNQNLRDWNVVSVSSFEQIFASTAFNHNIGNWNLAAVFSLGSVCPHILPRGLAASVLGPAVRRTRLLRSERCRAGFARCGA
jgi:hypothetical protein